jgi:hypothetical protein
MAKSNNLLYAAAVDGAVAGQLAQSFPTSTTGSQYTTMIAAAVAFATELDSQIPNDSTISVGGGVAIAPTTGAIIEAQLLKVGLIRELSYSAFAGRFSNDVTEADYTDLCEAIVTVYTPAAVAAGSY